jgi:predicted GNAT family N-acyltransferase
MKMIHIEPNQDLSMAVRVLNDSHATIAEKFDFTKETNPSNNAFIDATALRSQLLKGLDLFAMSENNQWVGCIAIEKSAKETDTFYIEKVSVIPSARHNGYGVRLMEFAVSRIMELGGKKASIALIDANSGLKKWYAAQGFIETGTKDYAHLPFRVCFMSKPLRASG